MDTRSGPTAAQVVNEASERELADLIYEYGEERRSRRIARAIAPANVPESAKRGAPQRAATRPEDQSFEAILPRVTFVTSNPLTLASK